jgi:hypothetical protein|tara:strand:- start:205 stop:480 length:276 start_codon:yes stop_codon:yes gene_type:complete
MRINISDEYQNSFYVFEMNPSDGTKYTVHVMPAEYGGLYVIVNEKSLWRWHGEDDAKFLCGNNNKYTKKAVIQIMNHHDARMELLAMEAVE